MNLREYTDPAEARAASHAIIAAMEGWRPENVTQWWFEVREGARGAIMLVTDEARLPQAERAKLIDEDEAERRGWTIKPRDEEGKIVVRR